MPEQASDDLIDVRAELESERDRLAAKVRELAADTKELDYDEGFADSAQVAAEMGENKVLYDQLRKDLDDIERALARIDDGSYGSCEVCGNPIGEARLEVMPATSRCIDHA